MTVNLIKNIVVFPFENISNHKVDDYLCSAIPIEITHLLSNYKTLRVTSFNSSMFNAKNIDFKKADSDIVLKGSILKLDGKIRATIQLINGSDNSCLSSIKLEESANNLFELIDKISIKIVEYVKVEIRNTESKTQVNSEAYHFYLKGIYHWNLWDEKNIQQAIDLFTKSIEMAPDFALGYARLSNCWSLLAGIQKGAIQKNYSHAKSNALKAIDLNPLLLEAHLSLGLIKLTNDLDILGAFYSFQRAFSINNFSPETHYYYAFYLLAIGEYKKAIEKLEFALEHNPFNVQMNSTYGFALSLYGKFETAEKQLKKTLLFAPDSDSTYDALFWVYILTKKYRLAEQLVKKKQSSIIHSPAAQVVLYHKMGLQKKVDYWMNELDVKMENGSEKTYYREASIAHLAVGNIEKGNQYFELLYQEKIGFIMALTHPAWLPFRNSGKFYKYKKRLKILNPPELSDKTPKNKEDIIVINSSTKEELAVSMANLLYIEAQGVYAKIVWINEGSMKEKLLRVSLSKIMVQVINPNLYRCHNSFAINTLLPFQINGNRKTMKLTLDGFSFEIPISRAQASIIHEHLKIK
jgi:TolB-like protein/Tfp pilus assembly protein PilF